MHMSYFVYVSKIAFFSFFLFVAAYAAINDHCTGDPGTGICLRTSKCSSVGGHSVSKLCPNDPKSIKCCEFIGCSAPGIGGGICKWTNNPCIPRGSKFVPGKQFILVYIFFINYH